MQVRSPVRTALLSCRMFLSHSQSLPPECICKIQTDGPLAQKRQMQGACAPHPLRSAGFRCAGRNPEAFRHTPSATSIAHFAPPEAKFPQSLAHFAPPEAKFPQSLFIWAQICYTNIVSFRRLMPEGIRASSSAGQSWRLITSRPYHAALPKLPNIRYFPARTAVKKRFHLFFTYERPFERALAGPVSSSYGPLA